MQLVTASQMQELDRRTIQVAKVPGLKLMERAGAGVVEAMVASFGSLRGKTVTVLCGKGNNGGDGFVVARLLHQKKVKVRTILFAKRTDLKGDAQSMYQRFGKSASSSAIKVSPSKETLHDMITNSDFIVDALLGTGISSPIQDPFRQAIGLINEAHKPTIAVDLPSGIHADTGAILGVAVRANLTVTFGYPKLGLYLGKAIDHAGTIKTVDIGIPAQFIEDMDIKTHLMTAKETHTCLPSRPQTSHKGTFGHTGIIAGSPGKTGAAALAAKAALRTGTGLVSVATPDGVNPILESKLLETMTVPMEETEAHTFSMQALPQLREFSAQRTALGIGPGIGTHPETVALVRALIPELDRPCVFDADALNAVAGHSELFGACKISPILTPHPGEMARLAQKPNSQSINEHRLDIASQFAREHTVIVVLKGARTLIAHPDGRIAICPLGNPGMATAGMGDVLTGMLASLLAQGLSPWNAALAGVYLHGLAGDLAAKKFGQTAMIAGDVIEQLPEAFNQIQSL